jgi:hypothetical protein
MNVHILALIDLRMVTEMTKTCSQWTRRHPIFRYNINKVVLKDIINKYTKMIGYKFEWRSVGNNWLPCFFCDLALCYFMAILVNYWYPVV